MFSFMKDNYFSPSSSKSLSVYIFFIHINTLRGGRIFFNPPLTPEFRSKNFLNVFFLLWLNDKIIDSAPNYYSVRKFNVRWLDLNTKKLISVIWDFSVLRDSKGENSLIPENPNFQAQSENFILLFWIIYCESAYSSDNFIYL